ncbi:MAG: DUF4355 domain-containing protein [Limosilactobacillus mucosae]|nr:DUF4355 domain-containing protein [Limosilactobacillus mucosae]
MSFDEQQHGLPMNLQFFAEQNEGSNGAPDNEPDQTSESKNESDKAQDNQPKTFTQDEVNKIISQRLERQKEQLKAKEDEAKKLSRMNAEQKASYELEKANKRADDAAAKLARYEMRDSAKQMLADGGFTVSDNALLDLVVTDNAESTQINVETLLKAVEAIREDTRTKLLAGKTPKVGGKEIKPVSAKDLIKMSTAERVKFQRENPAEYARILGGN